MGRLAGEVAIVTGAGRGIGGEGASRPAGQPHARARRAGRHAAGEWSPYGITGNVPCPSAMTEKLEGYAAEHPRLAEAVVRACRWAGTATRRTTSRRWCSRWPPIGATSPAPPSWWTAGAASCGNVPSDESTLYEDALMTAAALPDAQDLIADVDLTGYLEDAGWPR